MIWNKLFGKKQEINNSEQNEQTDVLIENPNQTNEPPEEITHIAPLFKFEGDDLYINSENNEQKEKGFSRFFSALSQTRNFVNENITSTFTTKKLSNDILDEFEESLILADMGTQTATMLRNKLEGKRFDKDITNDDIKSFLYEEIKTLLQPAEQMLTLPKNKKPIVINFVGVNGSGKTTTIGKIAHHFKSHGLSVMLVAADTFRAAATEQLEIWGQRNNIPVMTSGQGTDAAALVYKSYAQALADKIDIMLVDTAGRLQNKNNLMQELLKISRVLQKYDMELPHETILVLDATNGQNAVKQAEIFRDIANVTGLIMTKLDGSAKGGVLVGLSHILKLPIYAVGMGEKISDLHLFDAESFTKALL